MTLSEAFMATQTKVLRQILQTQQQIAQQMNRGPPHGANHEGPNQATTYAQFIGMKPPTFSKVEDPLQAEAWIKAIEAKFSAFVMPCSEENKANFAALQLQGEALMWWDHFKTMQQVLTRKVHSTPITQQAEQSWLHTRREQKTCQSIFPEN
jgi:hypothetical protein